MPGPPSGRLDQLHPRAVKLLEDAGYLWDPKLGVFVNRQAGRALSFESVRDRSVEWLEKWLQRPGQLPD